MQNKHHKQIYIALVLYTYKSKHMLNTIYLFINFKTCLNIFNTDIKQIQQIYIHIH